MTREEHDYIEHGKQFDRVAEDCPNCDGTGEVHLSDCCGAIANFDDELKEMFCMECLKKCHCVTEKCDDCKGHGEVLD